MNTLLVEHLVLSKVGKRATGHWAWPKIHVCGPNLAESCQNRPNRPYMSRSDTKTIFNVLTIYYQLSIILLIIDHPVMTFSLMNIIQELMNRFLKKKVHEQ